MHYVRVTEGSKLKKIYQLGLVLIALSLYGVVAIENTEAASCIKVKVIAQWGDPIANAKVCGITNCYGSTNSQGILYIKKQLMLDRIKATFKCGHGKVATSNTATIYPGVCSDITLKLGLCK
jgi:hypothetical protein